jgi:hypothetical protein
MAVTSLLLLLLGLDRGPRGGPSFPRARLRPGAGRRATRGGALLALRRAAPRFRLLCLGLAGICDLQLGHWRRWAVEVEDGLPHNCLMRESRCLK